MRRDGQPPKREEKERKDVSLTSPVWAHAAGSAGDRGWDAGKQMCHCHDSRSGIRAGSVFIASGNRFVSRAVNTHLTCSLDRLCVCVVQLCMKNTAYCSLKHDSLCFGFLCIVENVGKETKKQIIKFGRNGKMVRV